MSSVGIVDERGFGSLDVGHRRYRPFASTGNENGNRQIVEKTVVLDGTQITDAGLAHLKGFQHYRTQFSLRDTEITDAGLEYLEGLTKLRYVWLEGTQVTNEG